MYDEWENNAKWSPPPEPDRPPVPYRKGYSLDARQVIPWIPLSGAYLPHLLKNGRVDLYRKLAGRQWKMKDLYGATMVEYCLSYIGKTVPYENTDKTATFEIVEELSVGEPHDRESDAQIVVCKQTAGSEKDQLFVAKLYDPLYYQFYDYDWPNEPIHTVDLSESEFAAESAAYKQLDPHLGGTLIPKYHGSWICKVPLMGKVREVPFILMERLDGIPLRNLDPERYSPDTQLDVVAKAIEVETELYHYGVAQRVNPRTLMLCSGQDDIDSKDIRFKVYDFIWSDVISILGGKPEYERGPSRASPIVRSECANRANMYPWGPDEYIEEVWPTGSRQGWLKERWGGSDKYVIPEPKRVKSQ